ncbi:glutathione peroxidase [Neptunomonas qingdaonensis]|uniref:Glutathione peroxidase n=1 Tax=Neptunomonas qingdaonensis TaxID=1045558 RepID=A0A1I2LQ71_9GAMM|nr:glutathione peroxidase [Neptunomonas qingdaonensis]SFF81415.1 glutathione peroxidase [Neptunomonas qingdaonensis]
MKWIMPLPFLMLLAMLTLSPYSTAQKEIKVSSQACSAELRQALNYNFKRLGQDQQVNLCDTYGGKLIMIVNTASKCAFTPQYDGLESLYSRYKDKGFVVLGFPSNDFAGQEPGSEKQIKDFCQLTYGVNFPMFEKTHAARANASPFYQQLAAMAGEYPGWNFHKYLIAPDGKMLASFKSHIIPNDPTVISMIEQHLPAGVADE